MREPKRETLGEPGKIVVSRMIPLGFFDFRVSIKFHGTALRVVFKSDQGDLPPNFITEVQFDYDIDSIQRQLREKLIAKMEKFAGFKTTRKTAGGTCITVPEYVTNKDYSKACEELFEKNSSVGKK